MAEINEETLNNDDNEVIDNSAMAEEEKKDNAYKKSLMSQTFNMAWPSVVESVLVTLAGMIDTYMVSGLGKASIAAVGVTNQPKFFVFSVFFSINAAIAALVARRLGEKRREDANGLFVTGLAFVILACLILTILCIIFATPFMSLAGANEETLELSVKYFRVVMAGSIFNLILIYVNAAQRGCGNTRLAMVTNIVSNVVNIFFNYLLINGHWGFPALGVIGAALATVIGTIVACIMSVVTLFKKGGYLYLPYIKEKKIKPRKQYVKELSGITGTILGENIFMRFGFMLTSSMTARIGVEPYAAHLVGMNLMNVGFAFGDGFRSAMVALVGRSLGEKKPKKARDFVKTAQQFGLVISVISAILLLLFGRQFFNLYYPDDLTMLDYGSLISKFIAIIMPIQVCKIIFNGTLQGAGDVKFTLVGSTISITVVQPLAMLLLVNYMHLSLKGVWASILISQAVQLLLFGYRFFSGKWEKKVI